jgi:sugar phosphate isomerase/epimerase
MVKPLLSLASGVAPEASPLALIEAAAKTGYDAVGLWLELDRFSPSYRQQVGRALADSGLQVLDAEVFWIKPGPLDQAHLKMLDIACALGAQHALVVSSDPCIHSTAVKLAALCAHVKDQPIRLVLEFGAFTEVKGLEQAARIIRLAASDNLGLLLDALHWYRCGNTLEQIQALPAHWLTYAQLCDACGPAPDLTDTQAVRLEAVDYRLLPGDGQIPLQAWLKAMPRNLPLSLEVRSLSLRHAFADVTQRARVVLEHTQRWLLKNSPD